MVKLTEALVCKREPFYDANVAVWEWQEKTDGGCLNESCAFVQFHGKAPTSCVRDAVFLSTGLRECYFTRATRSNSGCVQGMILGIPTMSTGRLRDSSESSPLHSTRTSLFPRIAGAA